MELKLEVVLSSSIKRKKPWPRFCWLGQDKESVFLLDDKRISEINMVSGRTKKKHPKLYPLLNSVVTMTSSQNGMWLCGVLVSGKLFLWNKDKDLLKTTAEVSDVAHIIATVQGNATRLSLQVSGDGMRVLLVVITGQVLLWECTDVRNLMGVRDDTVSGRWARIQPLQDTILPSLQDKEASQHSIFVKTEVVGDVCLSAFVFTSGMKLTVTCLKIEWDESHVRAGPEGYSIQWTTKTYPMSRLSPPCRPVKSRGAVVPAFSPDGQLLAIVLNQREPRATQVLFVSTLNFVSISSHLGGCGSKKLDIPSKYIRSYWVGSASWTPGGLFLACVLKRGSLLLLARLGGLLSLTSSGCNVDFGPAQFLPLHPLVTYCPPMSAVIGEATRSSSSMSQHDVLRQRYSVTWHPRLLYLIVSDGYMVTVLRVLDKPSPALLLKTLLNDSRTDLEKASRILDKSQVHVRAWLDSVSSLSLDSSLEEIRPTAASVTSPGSTLPLFLQDTGTLGGTTELREKTLLEDESDFEGPPAGYNVVDGGRLEFASMFDTLHALDTPTDSGLFSDPDHEKHSARSDRKSLHRRDLGKIQAQLLTAWAFGMCPGGAVEHRSHLLNHTLRCMVRLAALLHLIPSSVVHSEKKKTSVSARILHLLKAMLSFLPWDSTYSDGPRCLGQVVEFSKQLVRLLLTPHPESYQTGLLQLSSHSLSTALVILQLVSDSLERTYSLQQRTLRSSGENESVSQLKQLRPSDIYCVPLLQDEEKPSFIRQARTAPHRPSNRMFGVWQWLYKVAQQYMEELQGFKGCDDWEDEQQRLSVILSQIQLSLQATGERLEAGPALLSYAGENYFLLGLYQKSADICCSEIWEAITKCSDRSVFQQTRLCLALLYGLLSQYRLKEAQELGDHMARVILIRSGYHKDNMTSAAEDSASSSCLPMDLHIDAACTVVQSLGRFMASYFTNQPLYVLPPHNVAVLPPLHLPHAAGFRHLPLCQEEAASAVRRQHLSDVWTVDYAQDLLLLGGLLPETVWLAYHLGDWKSAASLSLAYTNYCSEHFDFTRLRRRDFHLPTDLEPASIFQAELDCLLGTNVGSKELTDNIQDKSFADPLEGEDWDLLQVSIQDILQASVMTGVNIMSSSLSSLLVTAKELCSSLPALVPSGLYLPSPPLYCPQPSPNTQDSVGTLGQFTEVASRHKVSRVLQKLLLLLRSARCCRPAAQWYISHVRRARHLLYKIKKNYAYPSAAAEEKPFPEDLMKFISRSGFFKPRRHKDLEPDTIQTIICFRELCGLCWMLHVRDQLSLSCRKYQAARKRGADNQIPANSEMRSACVDALHWGCRYLPFSRFLNADEILQDILLSLMSELPPDSLVADTLVQAFPQEEESVRIPLREKHNSLLQRLSQCTVLEGEKEEANESMMILIRDKRRQRRKHLARLKKHLAPLELCLWDKEEQEEDRGSKHGGGTVTQLSLGTSLSNSTLNDCGFPLTYSDGETAENTSDTFSPDMLRSATSRSIEAEVQERRTASRTAIKMEKVIQEEQNTNPGDTKENDKRCDLEPPSLPVVGTWEFELEDEEYLNFLEVFLSYVVEKDNVDRRDSANELPLLKGFCSQLRESELHSVTFDTLTTMHRRQREGHHPTRRQWGSNTPVFRAGCCYKPAKHDGTPEPQASTVGSEANITRDTLSVTSLPGLRTGRQKGLFGLKQQANESSDRRIIGSRLSSEASPSPSSFLTRQPSDCVVFGSSTSLEAVTELQQVLDPKLDAQFPELGRVLQWMVRWSDRAVLQGHHGKKKKERGERIRGTSAEGVMIRVKISAPAVLTSLSLLEHRYAAVLEPDRHGAHTQVPETLQAAAPVLHTETDKKLERATSADTGYPGSANTPVTGADHNPQQELSIECRTDEAEELLFHRIPLPDDHNQMTFDAEMRPSTAQQSLLEDLDLTPEKEGKATDSEGLEVPSTVSSGDISEDICTSGTSLRLSHLDCAEKPEDVLISTSPASGPPSHPELQVLPAVQPTAPVHGEPSDPTGVQLTNTTVTPPDREPQTHTAGAPTAVSSDPQPSLPTHALPFGQHLGDDLVRLVQYVNFVSLREVLGASFSNLAAIRPNTGLVQSNTNSLPLNVPSSCAASSIPQPDALPVQTTSSVGIQTQACRMSNPQFSQVPANMYVNHPATTSLTGEQCPIPRNLPAVGNEAGVRYQEMQPLSVHAESPERRFRESIKLIPSSQGLLTTMEPSHSIPSDPTVLHANVGMKSNPISQVLGLRLLQLHYPLSPQQMSAHYSTTTQSVQMWHNDNFAALERPHHQFKLNDQSSFKKKEKKKRSRSSVPKRQQNLTFNSYPSYEPSPRTSQPQNGTRDPCFDRSMVQESFQLPPVLSAPKPAPTQIPHQLHFQSAHHSSTTFPVPLPTLSKPSAIVTAPIGETRIKLLHVDTGQKMILPVAVPPSPVARITSLEELARLAAGTQNPVEAGLRLLRADPYTECTKKAPTSPSSNSSKRQSRREEKATRARKTEVTFRPNESIIPTQGTTDETVNEKPAPTDEIIFGQSIAAVSSETLQTRQRLSHQAVSTTAELLAFAATCKKPPQCHDAYTSTDLDYSPTLVDKATAPRISVTAVSTDSQCLRDVQFFKEPHVKDTEETSQEPDTNLDLDRHPLMCVMDTEGEALHKDLPPYLSPEAKDGPSMYTFSPAPAQLHFATSVVGSAAAHPQPSPTIPEDPVNVSILPDKPKESPFSPTESNKDQERIPSGDTAGPSDIEISQAKNIEDPRTCSTSTNGWFSLHVPVMDAQLAALENIADSLEKDFSSARMFVSPNGVNPPVLAPEVKTGAALLRMVGLPVPREAWRSGTVEDLDTGLVIHNESSTSEGKPSVLPSSSVDSRPAGPSCLYSPASKDALHQDISEDLTAPSGSTSPWLDDPETAEILDNVVKGGILSSDDLELFKSQTVPQSSRADQQQSNRLGQEDVPPDDERRQLKMWMRRKHRERMAVFQKHRETLREKERTPYSAPARETTNKNVTATWKSRQGKEKVMLLEHYNQRIVDVSSLLNDLSTGRPAVSRSSRAEGVSLPTTQPSHAPPSGSTHSRPAEDKKGAVKSLSGQAQAHIHQRTAEAHSRPLDDYHKRLGLHRRVTFLPSDRLSQVTRRGMLTDTKSHPKLHTAGPEELQQGGRHRNTGFDSIPSEGTPIRRDKLKTGREAVSGPLDEKENDGGASEMDWLDNLSDSTSSNIDWAAIEEIMAEDEA